MFLQDRKERFNRKWMKKGVNGTKEIILCLDPTALTLINKKDGI